MFHWIPLLPTCATVPIERPLSVPYLVQEPSVQQQLLSLSAPSRCMDYIRERTCPHNDLLVMLLANLTSLEEGAAELLQLGKGALEGLHL